MFHQGGHHGQVGWQSCASNRRIASDGAGDREILAAEGAKVVVGDVLDEQGAVVESRPKALSGTSVFC